MLKLKTLNSDSFALSNREQYPK